jgi:hypothetical protein
MVTNPCASPARVAAGNRVPGGGHADSAPSDDSMTITSARIRLEYRYVLHSRSGSV